jgi:hypothetical protein
MCGGEHGRQVKHQCLLKNEFFAFKTPGPAKKFSPAPQKAFKPPQRSFGFRLNHRPGRPLPGPPPPSFSRPPQPPSPAALPSRPPCCVPGAKRGKAPRSEAREKPPERSEGKAPRSEARRNQKAPEELSQLLRSLLRI